MFPQRDVHKISNVQIKLDNKDRWKSDYRKRFEDDVQRQNSLSPPRDHERAGIGSKLESVYNQGGTGPNGP